MHSLAEEAEKQGTLYANTVAGDAECRVGIGELLL